MGTRCRQRTEGPRRVVDQRMRRAGVLGIARRSLDHQVSALVVVCAVAGAVFALLLVTVGLRDGVAPGWDLDVHGWVLARRSWVLTTIARSLSLTAPAMATVLVAATSLLLSAGNAGQRMRI